MVALTVRGSGTFSKLSPYEVGLSIFLLRFAEDQGEQMLCMEVLLEELKQATPGNLKTLPDLQHHLQQRKEGGREACKAWEILRAGLEDLNSPDAFFELFRALESVICRELVSASVMHSTGAFGQLARRLVLAFKQSSFEEIVKVYDAVQDFLQANSKENFNSRSWKDGTGFGADVGLVLRKRSGAGFPSEEIDELRRQKLPSAHSTFLQYVHSAERRFADSAATLLRSFHDQRRSESVSTPSGVETIQDAVLALANLSLEMKHVDDALLALEDSIRAAQESSDASCLCASLYLLSLILYHCKLPSLAATLLRRCLHRSEALGLPLLECLSSLALARILALQPARRSFDWAGARALESRFPGPSAASATASAAGFRAWAYLGRHGTRGSGFGVLAGLGDTPAREVLAHVTLASLLSTQAGSLELLRPKVLLCQAGISQAFALSSSAMCFQTSLDLYKDQLSADDRGMALCQLAEASESEQALQSLMSQDLPYCHRVHVAGPKFGQHLVSQGHTLAIPAIVFQIAGALGTSSLAEAAIRFQKFNNSCRRHAGHLLAAYQSSQEALREGKATMELCEHLLALAEVDVNPVSAVGACTRCIAMAEDTRQELRGRALLRLARLKLELGSPKEALQLTEEAAQGGHSALLEAECLLELSCRNPRPQLLEAVLERLTAAVQHEALDFSALQRCHYFMARTCHELGRASQRDRHASALRRLSEGCCLGVALYPAI